MPSHHSLLAFVLLGGCNQAFDLAATQPIDAQYFDAPAPSCPDIGTPPSFTDDLHQVQLQNCTDYTVSSNGRALARCSGVIEEGLVDRDLAPATGLEPPPSTYYLRPRLGPDGNSAIIYVADKSSVPRVYFGVFTRANDGTWSKTGEIDVTNPFSSSSTSRNGRLMVVSPAGLHELASDSSGAWTTHGLYTASDLGVTSMSDGVALTADGLRLTFRGLLPNTPSITMLYADRPNIDAAFSHAVALPTIEYFPNAFLTEDCARLYTSALGTVFYVTPP